MDIPEHFKLHGEFLTHLVLREVVKKNTKNWYTIDALGAIFVILTMLTLAMWTLLTILTLNWSNPTLTAFPIWIQLYLNLTRHTTWNQPLKYPPRLPSLLLYDSNLCASGILSSCLHTLPCWNVFCYFFIFLCIFFIFASFLFVHLFYLCIFFSFLCKV